jgi:hypothetical protein
MSLLEDYNEKTQAYYEKSLKFYEKRQIYYISESNSTSGEHHKRKIDNTANFRKTFNDIEKYFLSDECDWKDIPKYHVDIKFINHLRRYCETLKNNNLAFNDKTALELIAEGRVALDWKTVTETYRLVLTSWTEANLLYEDAGKLFRTMANKLLQDVFIRPVRVINAVNFSELEPKADDSNLQYRPWLSSFIYSVGKRKCRVCGKPSIDTDVCYDHNAK